MRARFLRRDERTYALSIFGKTVPLDDILITDGSGPEIGPVEPFESPTGRSKYCLALGRDGYASCLTNGTRTSFVHGLTHIWQRRFAPAKARNLCSHGAPSYQLGKAWRDYTSEQQARLVADWVEDGMLLSDPRASYISNHIRIGAS
jgi:hypothetical protein